MMSLNRSKVPSNCAFPEAKPFTGGEKDLKDGEDMFYLLFFLAYTLED